MHINRYIFRERMNLFQFSFSRCIRAPG